MIKFSKSVALSLFLAIALSGLALAQNGSSSSPEGTYAVTAIGSEVGTIAFTLVLKRAVDKWTGEIVDSPLPLTIKTVTVDADNKVTVIAGTGDAEVTIVGKYDGTKIVGDWTAGEAKGTWSAARKEAVVAKTASVGTPAMAGPTSAASLALLEGTYDAEVTADGQGSLPFTLVLTLTGGKLVPEVKNAEALGATAFEVNGENVNLSATFQGNPFSLPGKITGNSMGGKWEAGGLTGSWSAKKKAN
ncbi:MAG: hypothetical protein ABI882_01750 [Acidobacteriota bacterium]